MAIINVTKKKTWKGTSQADTFNVNGGRGSILVGGKGADTYNINWAKSGDISINKGETITGLGKDVVKISGASYANFTATYIGNSKKAIQLTDKNGKYIRLYNVDKSPMASVKFGSTTVKMADIKKTADKTKMIAVSGSGQWDDVLQEYKLPTFTGTSGSDRFYLKNYGNQVNIKGYNSAKDIIDLSAYNSKLKTGWGIAKCFDVNTRENSKDLYIDLSIVNDDHCYWDKKNNRPYGEIGYIKLKNFFTTANSVKTVRFSDETWNVVGKGASGLSYDMTRYANKLCFASTIKSATLTNYNSESIINVEAMADEKTVPELNLKRSGSNLILEALVDDKVQSKLTFQNFYKKNVAPHLWLDGELDTLLYMGTDGADKVNLNKLCSNKDAFGVVYGAGAGDDVITAGGGDYFIQAGKGNDTITIVSKDDNIPDYGDSHIWGTSGTNKISVTYGGYVAVDGGIGKDTVTIKTSNEVEVRGDGGDDIITIDKAKNYAYISGDDGKDTIEIKNTAHFTIDGGCGNDKYLVDWKNVLQGFIEQSNDAGLNNSVKQEQDTLTLSNAKKSDFTFSYDEWNTHDLIMKHNTTGRELRISNWDSNMLYKVTFKSGSVSQTIYGSSIDAEAKKYLEVTSNY